MDEKLIKQIKSNRENPIIGVIGAIFPDNNYKKIMGIEVGYSLREFVESKAGTIFTGGVEGVGVDVYTGIIKYCIDKKINEHMIDDKFFVLIPSGLEILDKNTFDKREIREYVPIAYEPLGYLSKRGSLDKIVAGSDMAERRKYLAEVADILIVVNGGAGTVHEAVMGLCNKKPVISLYETGGAAKMLKDGLNMKSVVDTDIIETNLFDVDKNYLYFANNIKSMIDIVKNLV
jgi:hypothetical protein